MIFPVNTDIIALVKGTVESMMPYASAHQVTLRFDTNLSRKDASYFSKVFKEVELRTPSQFKSY